MIINAIYLDLDGVLVDFVGGVMRAFGLDPQLGATVTSWDGIPDVLTRETGYAISDADMWRVIEGARFWASLDWTPRGRELFEAVRDSGIPYVFMSTPCSDPYSAAGKLQWLEQHVPGDVRRYALTPCKHHMAHRGALLIDDGDHNIERFRAHDGKAFLWPAPWNEYGTMPSADAVERVRKVLATCRRIETHTRGYSIVAGSDR